MQIHVDTRCSKGKERRIRDQTRKGGIAAALSVFEPDGGLD
jgi:hypothetical protein